MAQLRKAGDRERARQAIASLRLWLKKNHNELWNHIEMNNDKQQTAKQVEEKWGRFGKVVVAVGVVSAAYNWLVEPLLYRGTRWELMLAAMVGMVALAAILFIAIKNIWYKKGQARTKIKAGLFLLAAASLPYIIAVGLRSTS